MVKGGTKYSKDEKINYVILLHYRYKDDCEKCASVMKINLFELAAWKVQFMSEAKLIMMEHEKAVADEPIPTHQEIIETGMKRLFLMVKKEDDPSKIARAITAIAELEKSNGSGGKKAERSIFEEMNDKLIKKQGNEK